MFFPGPAGLRMTLQSRHGATESSCCSSPAAWLDDEESEGVGQDSPPCAPGKEMTTSLRGSHGTTLAEILHHHNSGSATKPDRTVEVLAHSIRRGGVFVPAPTSVHSSSQGVLVDGEGGTSGGEPEDTPLDKAVAIAPMGGDELARIREEFFGSDVSVMCFCLW